MIELIKEIFALFNFLLSLIVSYIFGENSSGGSKYDFLITKYIDLFSLDLNSGIQVFKDDKQSHFPFFIYLFLI